jgi:hypothetical protein
MSAIVDEPEWEHIRECTDCGMAFIVLRGAIEQSTMNQKFKIQ